MDRIFDINYDYENITLHFPRNAAASKPLTPEQWAALEKCERSMYFRESGANAWTDVVDNDGSPLLRAIWDHTALAVESTLDPEVNDSHAHMWETARRVAAALAVMSFGKEFLMK